jgi:hypothetical protein
MDSDLFPIPIKLANLLKDTPTFLGGLSQDLGRVLHPQHAATSALTRSADSQRSVAVRVWLHGTDGMRGCEFVG